MKRDIIEQQLKAELFKLETSGSSEITDQVIAFRGAITRVSEGDYDKSLGDPKFIDVLLSQLKPVRIWFDLITGTSGYNRRRPKLNSLTFFQEPNSQDFVIPDTQHSQVASQEDIEASGVVSEVALISQSGAKADDPDCIDVTPPSKPVRHLMKQSSKSESNKKGAGRKKKVVDPLAEDDMKKLNDLSPDIFDRFLDYENMSPSRMDFKANLIIFSHYDFVLPVETLDYLFMHGALGVMIVSDLELPNAFDAIATTTVQVKKKEKQMFTVERVITLLPSNKTAKHNRGGMCCNNMFLILFTHVNHKADVLYNVILNEAEDEESTTSQASTPTSRSTPVKKKSLIPTMISQVWKMAPLPKPERRPWRDIKVGRQIPIATYDLILDHLHQVRLLANNISSVIYVGVGQGSLLVSCIKVSQLGEPPVKTGGAPNYINTPLI